MCLSMTFNGFCRQHPGHYFLYRNTPLHRKAIAYAAAVFAWCAINVSGNVYQWLYATTPPDSCIIPAGVECDEHQTNSNCG